MIGHVAWLTAERQGAWDARGRAPNMAMTVAVAAGCGAGASGKPAPSPTSAGAVGHEYIEVFRSQCCWGPP